ncbi:CDP-glycerol glycerophosphotransferase family protein [Burkholderia ubonensis]|uniref:CDP-glycerol glycerophosphotransferase family protein n=1 Tax=Burkholderia ubonensis TaxID=101571 RepID=UPI0012F79EF1|nr:CDP-glycerol glycerophosphotransferase family protein [Burkholderia ubonensis]
MGAPLNCIINYPLDREILTELARLELHVAIAEHATMQQWGNYMLIDDDVVLPNDRDRLEEIEMMLMTLEQVPWGLFALGAIGLRGKSLASSKRIVQIEAVERLSCYIVHARAFAHCAEVFRTRLLAARLRLLGIDCNCTGSPGLEDGWIALSRNWAHATPEAGAGKSAAILENTAFDCTIHCEATSPPSVPSREAVVAFSVSCRLHYELYHSTLESLRARGIDCCLILEDVTDTGFFDELTEVAQRANHAGISVVLQSTVVRRGIIFEILVSPYFLPRIARSGRVHVRAMYGIGKDNWDFAAWNVLYDKILCYSQYHVDNLQIGDNCVVVGNPHFDKWYRDEIESIATYLELAPHKPTILYCPTYGVLSSLQAWASDLSKLQNDYNIIVKLHHRSACAKECASEHMIARQLFRRVVTGAQWNMALLKISDFVLTDHSSFIFDAIQANRRSIILSSVESELAIDQGMGWTHILSAEVRIRSQLPTATDIEQLRFYLSPDHDWQAKQATFDDIRARYCDPRQDGQAGSRAAQCIAGLLENRVENKGHQLRSCLRGMVLGSK